MMREYCKPQDRIACSEIFNMKKFNEFLQKYNIVVYDRYDIRFNLIEVRFGTMTSSVDITQHVKDRFVKNNTLDIPANYNFNNISGDPALFKKKHIYIKYSLNGNVYQEVIDDTVNITFDVDKAFYINVFGWNNNYNRIIFDDILSNIPFNDVFYERANAFLSTLDPAKKRNVLHLKVEHDAIEHFANNVFRMPYNEYKTILENKFIRLIDKYIDSDSENIILSYSLDNSVLDFLKNKGYKYYFSNKNTNIGRELNAIVDLIIGSSCSNTFVGTFNLDNSNINGSSFTYTLIQRLNKNVNKALFDPNVLQYSDKYIKGT
jgi:hypothetical protein